MLHGDTLNLEQLERACVIRALKATRGVQKEAANLLDKLQMITRFNYCISTGKDIVPQRCRDTVGTDFNSSNNARHTSRSNRVSLQL